jgi:hypothetical protein
MKSKSNKNNSNNDGGDEHEQLHGKNKLANDEDKPATTGEDQNCEEETDLDLEVCCTYLD